MLVGSLSSVEWLVRGSWEAVWTVITVRSSVAPTLAIVAGVVQNATRTMLAMETVVEAAIVTESVK